MKNKISVHQFTPSISSGDGVSRGVLMTRDILHDLGYESSIYSNDIEAGLKGDVHHLSQYKADKDNILLYHHCIGHINHDAIMAYPDTRVLVYHNITPSHFFSGEPHLQQACDQGRAQLASALPHITASYADSAYNADELKAEGYVNPEVLPLLVDIEACLQKGAVAKSDLFAGDDFNIVFIGRLVSNKNQHQLIDVLHDLKKIIPEKNIKLHLVGGFSEPDYVEFMRSQVSLLGLDDNVSFVGKVSDAELYDYMKSSDLFLCLSEHEGFCMPLLEAICCGLPVLAYKAGGVPTTLGSEGLFSFKAPDAVAAMVADYIQQPEKRAQLAGYQKQHLTGFYKASLKLRLQSFIERVLLSRH